MSRKKNHARKQSEHRFSYKLPHLEFKALVASIRKGELKPLREESPRVAIYKVMLGTKSALAVYDRTFATIVTFLPPDAPGHPYHQSHTTRRTRSCT
jgi:hypothetical protein